MRYVKQFVKRAARGGMPPAGVRAAGLVVLLYLLLSVSGSAAQTPPPLPECPNPLPDADLVTAHYRVMCGHCYAMPTSTPTALPLLPTSTGTVTPLPTSTRTLTPTFTPIASNTPFPADEPPQAALWDAALSEWHGFASWGHITGSYYFLQYFDVQWRAGYSTNFTVPRVDAFIIGVNWSIQDAPSDIVVTAQPSFSYLSLWSTQFEDLPYQITSAGCAYDAQSAGVWSWVCLGDANNIPPYYDWPDTQIHQGAINWTTSNFPTDLSFGVQLESGVPTPSSPIEGEMMITIILDIGGGNQEYNPDETPEASATPGASATPVQPDYYLSEPSIVTHGGYNRTSLDTPVTVTEDTYGGIFQLTYGAAAPYWAAVKTRGDYGIGGDNSTEVLPYGTTVCTDKVNGEICNRFASQFSNFVIQTWNSGSFSPMMTQGQTTNHFMDMWCDWGRYCSATGTIYFIYNGVPPSGQPTALPPTWTPTSTLTLRPTRTPAPTNTPTPTKTPYGFDDSCLIPDYRTSPTPQNTSTASPTVITSTPAPTQSLTPSATLPPDTATPYHATQQAGATATTQHLSTPSNASTATVAAFSTMIVATAEQSAQSPAGWGSNSESDGWLEPSNAPVVDIPQSTSGDMSSSNGDFVLDFNTNLKRGKCYVLLPDTHQAKFNMDGFGVCVTWFDIPQTRMFGITIPWAAALLIMPIISIVRMFMRLGA